MAFPVVALPLLVIAAAACPRTPPVKALVRAGMDPLSVTTDLNLAEIRKLARQANPVAADPLYGFYLGGVTVAIEVDIGNEAQDACIGPIDIRVTMKLTNRHIEVAQELRNDPCKFAKVVAHYRRHAEAEEAVFARYVERVTATLSHTPAASFFVDAGAGAGGKQIVLAVQSIIEPVLASMRADEISAGTAIDTPAEVRNLETACTNRPSNEL